MTTLPIVGGPGTTALHRIDDPFSDCPSARGLEDTLDRMPTFPLRHGGPILSSEPAPVQSRPSRAIVIPVPPCVLDEPLAEPSRTSVSQRILVLAMSAIILAAAITAVREHASDLHVSDWMRGASTLFGAEADATIATARLVPSGPETRQATSALGLALKATEDVAVEQRQAQVPALRLPDVVLSARSRARLSHGEHERARARARQRAHNAAQSAIQATSSNQGSPVFDDAVPPNPYAPGVTR